MTMGTVELPQGDITPDISELQGREEAHPAVAVDLVGPARTQKLPNPSWAVSQKTVSNTGDPVCLLKKDLTRARAVIRASGGAAYIAPSRAEAAAAIGLLPDGQALTLETTAAVWAYGGAAAVVVVAHSEHWTE